MILFGTLFGGIGLFFAITFIAISIATGELIFGLVGGGIGILFTIIGFFVLYEDFKNKAHKKDIINRGTRVTGVIIDARSGTGVMVNGNLPIDVVVEAEYMGAIREFIVSTDEYNYSKYPVGACVDIAVDGIEAALIKGSVRFIEGITYNKKYEKQECIDNNQPQNTFGGSYTVTVEPDGTYKYN